jgi:Fungal specific transcription factor domain
MEGQLSLALEGNQFPRDLESGTGPKAQNIAGFNQYQPTDTTSHAFGESLLGSAPLVIPEYDRISQTSNITSLSQPNIARPSAALLADRMLVPISGNKAPIFQELPSKEKALHLIPIFFQGINSVYPIFDQITFMSKFDSTYGLDCSDSDPGWWAALNVVLALAYQQPDMPAPEPQEDLEAWGYFQNALSTTNQLMTRNYTLASVQALLGMAMVMMSMPDQRPIASLTSSAIKIAHNLGLHRQYQYPVLSAVESAERMRVFWVAYSFDKDISLQTREPPTQGDEDMDVELPPENDYVSFQRAGVRHDLFYFRTRLAIIQGQIYRRLLSVKAGKQSASERATAAEELEITLQTWRRSVPIDLFRDSSSPPLDRSISDTSRHPVFLQLIYFSSLAIIHEALPVFPWYDEIQSSEVGIRVMSARVTFPGEARSAIKLLNLLPRRRFACVWSASSHICLAGLPLLRPES